MYCCRIVNGIKNKNIKKQPWSNVECFAFGGATVRFAALETSFHAANHTIPPPPSYEGSPHCPKAVFYVFCFGAPSIDPLNRYRSLRSSSVFCRRITVSPAVLSSSISVLILPAFLHDTVSSSLISNWVSLSFSLWLW